jgi:hypothetical protein
LERCRGPAARGRAPRSSVEGQGASIVSTEALRGLALLCRDGLRTVRAHEQLAARLLGAELRDRELGAFPRRYSAVSRWSASAFFGALELVGGSRSGSSEPGRRLEGVRCFHGGVARSRADERGRSSGRRIESAARGRAPRSSALCEGAPNVSTEVRDRSSSVPEALRSPRFGRRRVAGFQAGFDAVLDRPPCPSGRGARSAKRGEVRGS